MSDFVQFVDECLWVFLNNVCCESGLAELIEMEETASAPEEILASCGMHLQQHLVDEQLLVEFVGRFRNVLDKVRETDGCLQADWDAKILARLLVAGQNANTRASIGDCLTILTTMADFPSSASAAVAAWRCTKARTHS